MSGAIVGVTKDTIKKVGENQTIIDTPNRTSLWQAQTPQIFRRELLTKAYNSAIEKDFFGTDDASLVERIGGDIKIVEGDRKNLKITYPIDLKIAEMILKENEGNMRIGYGFDTHKLVKDRPLIIGGVEVPFEKGLYMDTQMQTFCYML